MAAAVWASRRSKPWPYRPQSTGVGAVEISPAGLASPPRRPRGVLAMPRPQTDRGPRQRCETADLTEPRRTVQFRTRVLSSRGRSPGSFRIAIYDLRVRSGTGSDRRERTLGVTTHRTKGHDGPLGTPTSGAAADGTLPATGENPVGPSLPWAQVPVPSSVAPFRSSLVGIATVSTQLDPEQRGSGRAREARAALGSAEPVTADRAVDATPGRGVTYSRIDTPSKTLSSGDPRSTGSVL